MPEQDTTIINKDLSALEQLQSVLRRLAEFTAMFEVADKKLREREDALEQRVVRSEKLIRNQLDALKSVMNSFQEIMTEAGAARWRLAAEKALAQGREQVSALGSMQQEIKETLETSCARLDQAVTFAIKGVGDVVETVRISDFKQLAQTTSYRIEEVVSDCVRRFRRVAKWFHWKNLALVLAVTLVSAVIMGLYIDDEWPWQAHQQILQQRMAGQMLLQAWPHLSLIEKQDILQSIPAGISPLPR